MRKGKSSKPRHLGLKLIAFSLAVLLELYFYSPDNSVTLKLLVPIEFQGLPPQMMIVEPPGAERGIPAMVELRGPGPLVTQLRNRNNVLVVPIQQETPGRITASVDPGTLGVPTGVEVLSVDPARVELITDRVAAKELRIAVSTSGEPEEGFVVDSVRVFPSTVVVRGPQSRLEELWTIETKPVILDGLRQSERRELILSPPGPLMTLGVTIVAVDISVSEVKIERTFEGVNIRVLAPAGYAASVEPSRVDVVLSGPERILADLDRDSLSLVADGRGLDSGRHRVAVEGVFPEGVLLVRTAPEDVAISMVSSDE